MPRNSAKILRHPANLRRSFEAAGVHPALSSWISAAQPIDNDIRAGLRQIRARARDAAQNEDHMKMFLRMVETNVIGRQGITVQAKPRRANGSPDTAATEIIESAWETQCERGNWDVTGQHSRKGFARLVARTVAMDGEALVRYHEMSADAPTGFAVELIDAESLDMDYSTELRNGNYVRMGVEMTRHRRPVAYHLFSDPPPHATYGHYSQTERVRVPASEIDHIFLPEWTWQSRGIPWAATALRRLKMLGGYEEAAITAARAAAVKSSVYTRQEWAPPEMMPNGELQDDGSFVQDLSPGGAEIVPYGYDIKPLDWAWPNTDHGDFVRDSLRGIASGLGVNSNTLSNDLTGVNFSSLRHGAITERDMWMTLQDWFIDWFERPARDRWLTHAITTGSIRRRNGDPFDKIRMPDLMRATFQGRRWPWVDPTKDIAAAKLEVSLGARSVSDIIRERGREPDEVWAELESDLTRLQSLGLSLDDIIGGADTQQDTGDRQDAE